ncbi:MAG TPA: XRE family transcriptional regulator [Actinophytocola sp.]|uniref:XRE family transcriptional regulator n=1 Tax=Actinophytocola sp. TaxID=1872138 RepID=UPI002DDCB51B|nr:XRE family transcriptional regulator [Actinophytocola sp.]HEV2782305.1 XRE family transcriptional regulator [Actinophytocola sp.]
MQSSDDPRYALARRLRALRERHWPGRKITQGQLAEALSHSEHASSPLISSWESTTNPALPSDTRLADYATFFATERSVASRPFRLFDLAELTPDERAQREALLRELLELRSRSARSSTDDLSATLVDELGQFWHFSDLEDVVIVCAEVPEDLRRDMPYSDPDDPDYVDLYRYADPDALIELHGHIRAVNPTIQVHFRTTATAIPDDYTTHLVLLGGVDWNIVTAHLQHRSEFPVRQVAREGDRIGGFEVVNGEEHPLFEPILHEESGGQRILLEDVAHFYRAPNPFNKERTVTICNGMFGRGTLGAVRALTDAKLRGRNEEYLKHRFSEFDTLSIVTRVPIVNGSVVTPDWTVRGTLLHEWPEKNA